MPSILLTVLKKSTIPVHPRFLLETIPGTGVRSSLYSTRCYESLQDTTSKGLCKSRLRICSSNETRKIHPPTKQHRFPLVYKCYITKIILHIPLFFHPVFFSQNKSPIFINMFQSNILESYQILQGTHSQGSSYPVVSKASQAQKGKLCAHIHGLCFYCSPQPL